MLPLRVDGSCVVLDCGGRYEDGIDVVVIKMGLMWLNP